MSLDINTAMEMLETSFGESMSKIYIPSIKQSVEFKPLTVGMQKSISKMSLDFDDDVEYQILKISILKTLCLDKELDIEKLTEVDFTSMLAQLRLNNFTEPLKLIIPCINPKCQKSFNLNINIDDIQDRCTKFEFQTKDIERTLKINNENMKFKFEITESSIMSNIEYQQYITFLSNDENSVIDINNARVLSYPLKFIKNIYINGQQITQQIDNEIVGFSQFPMSDKIKVIDNLPPKVYSEGKNSVLYKVLDLFPYTRLLKLFPEIKCPYCKQPVEGVVTNDSFFII